MKVVFFFGIAPEGSSCRQSFRSLPRFGTYDTQRAARTRRHRADTRAPSDERTSRTAWCVTVETRPCPEPCPRHARRPRSRRCSRAELDERATFPSLTRAPPPSSLPSRHTHRVSSASCDASRNPRARYAPAPALVPGRERYPPSLPRRARATSRAQILRSADTSAVRNVFSSYLLADARVPERLARFPRPAS